jgi:uncharacterized protein (TIGR03382 family)
MKYLRTLWFSALALGGLAAASDATMITYEFAGVIKNGHYTPYNYFGAGATFEATAVFDTTAASTYNGPGGWGGQQTTRPLVSMSLTVHTIANGDWTATANSSLRNVDVVNDLYSDSAQFSAVGIAAAPVGGLTANTFNISFGGANTILSSTAVPMDFDLGLWDPYGSATQTYLKIYLNDFSQNVTFRLTDVSSSDGSVPPPTPSVPEIAGTAPLMAWSLLGVLLLRRRRAAR